MTRQSGHLDLEFATDELGKTHLVRRDQKFPLHFATPFFLDDGVPEMAFVYVQNPSGAIFSGDKLRLKISVRDGGKVHITSTSATKLHRMQNCPASQLVQLDVKEGSYIEYRPDQLIPQAGSCYDQKMLIDLDRDSSLMVSEVIAPGRFSRGEIFKFKRLSFETRISVNDEEMFIDRSVLEPADMPLDLRGLLGKFLYSGRIIVLAPNLKLEKMLDAVSSFETIGKDFRLGLGVLPDGMGIQVRVLSQSSIGISRVMDDVWSHLRSHLIGAPPPLIRK